MRFHETVHGVWFDDLDAFQILHNVRYLLILERTVGAPWQARGRGPPSTPSSAPRTTWTSTTSCARTTSTTTRLSAGSARSDAVSGERMGRTSLTFGFAVLPMDEDRPYATGQRVLVRVDPEARTPVPWTDAFRAAMAPYQRDPDAT